MNFTVENAIQWLEKASHKYEVNKDYLIKLDEPIGDGDHGLHMAQGFKEVVHVLHEHEFATVAEVMKATAMTVMSKVGGASGPLYGTVFLRMSFVFKGKKVINYPTFVHGLEEALKGLKRRGRAEEGDKTLVDVWEPIVRELKRTDHFEAKSFIETAKNAMERTKETIGVKGRAAYFKENTIGHIDPGSASSYYLFEALAEVLEGGG